MNSSILCTNCWSCITHCREAGSQAAVELNSSGSVQVLNKAVACQALQLHSPINWESQPQSALQYITHFSKLAEFTAHYKLANDRACFVEYKF